MCATSKFDGWRGAVRVLINEEDIGVPVLFCTMRGRFGMGAVYRYCANRRSMCEWVSVKRCMHNALA